MLDVSNIGPVEMLAVSFPGTQFNGEILPALKDLTDKGLIRVIDLMVVTKDMDGTVQVLEMNDLEGGASAELRMVASDLDSDGLLGEDDVELAAEELQPGNTAALLVWEDRWAAPIASAIRDAGGTMLAYERVPREAVEEIVAATTRT